MTNETHKVVMAVKGNSYFMVGDGPDDKDNVLPELLREGWVVESACAAPEGRNECVYFILRKPA